MKINEQCPFQMSPDVSSLLETATGHTLFESENERQKIEPVLIPLPTASRNFPNVKT